MSQASTEVKNAREEEGRRGRELSHLTREGNSVPKKVKTTYFFDDREDPRLIIVVSVRANTNIDPTWMTVRLVRCSKFEYTEGIQSRIRVISNFRRVKCQVKGQWVGGRGL